MKTRKILAASTAALLAFGTTAAYVASATDVTVTAPTDFTDFSEMTPDEFTELVDGVQVKVTKAAQEKNKAYSLGAWAGAAATMGDFFEVSSGKAALTASTELSALEGTSKKNILKAVKLNDDKDGLETEFGTKKIQLFDVTVSYDSDSDEVSVDDIKLKGDVTVKLTSTVAKGNVYHLSSDGKTLEKVNAKVTKKSDDSEYYYTFETNQFSPYIVADISVSGLASVGTAATTSDDSDASDASDGATSTNPETGIALAIAPVVLAAGAVAVVALKKKH